MAMAEMPPSALTISTTAGSSKDTQSHRTLPFGVRTSSARWPMAKCGSTPMPVSPDSSKRIEFRLVRRSLSCVVHCWPVTLRYCRSSWQTAQAAGGCSLSACCVPQVVQMKFGIRRHRPFLAASSSSITASSVCRSCKPVNVCPPITNMGTPVTPASS